MKTSTKDKASTHTYSLFTAVAMIVGIVIGSGIFFKSDNILVATNGNVFLGVLVFVIGAFAIIFGSLCIGELASRTDQPGGIITYAETFLGERMACCFGWFQTFVYFPAITVIVSWVVGIYTCILFDLPSTFSLQMGIGLLYLTLCFVWNTLSAAFGGIFQNITMVLKLLPLIFVAFCGLLFGNPLSSLSHLSSQTFQAAGNSLWISAIGPIAFSFDGWIVSTSIAHEIKNSKRNLPLALIIAPLLILIVYVLYFIGIVSYLGPAQVMSLGDDHISLIATKLIGSLGAKIVIIFVILSVMGTVNGLVLGFIRLPFSLAFRRMLPFSNVFFKRNPEAAADNTVKLPVISSVYAFVLSLLWVVVHYVVSHFNLLQNSDISEIPIAVSYLLYILLYVQVIRLYRKKEIKGWARGLLIPLLAIIGALIPIYGGIQNGLFLFYALFCLFVILLSLFYYNRFHSGRTNKRPR